MISRSAEYALRATVCLAANADQSMTVNQIASLAHIPSSYLSKIIQELTKKKIVNSQRGKKGGISLACTPSQLTVLSVINAVSPLERINICFLDDENGLDLCPLQICINDAVSSVEAAFSKMTIANLISTPNITITKKI